MRTDQYSYQQATRISGLGLLLQVAAGLLLLIFGRIAGSTAFTFASFFVLAGAVVWAGLAVVFHQHRLAALEAMEAEEIREQRGTVFDQERAIEAAVAARRLAQMYAVLMPVLSLVLAGALAVFGYLTLAYMYSLDEVIPAADARAAADYASFSVGAARGWQLAVCVSLSLVAFIVSRFVAGMSKQVMWQNLRGGAGFMVGTALLLLAIGVGLVFDVLGKPRVLEGVVVGIGVFEIFVASEIALNFILNLYRPRRKGEIPRPAFDSRVLSLFAAPDSIVRSINEAVNYQFGFDITSSWGYQLMLRSVVWLLVLGAGVLVLLSCIVVVPPGQQAVRLRGGAIVGDVHSRGSMLLKLPWPIETAQVHDVALIRSLVLGTKQLPLQKVNLWSGDTPADPDRNPFIVAAPRLAASVERGLSAAPAAAADAPADAGAEEVSEQFALVDADIIMKYRVREDGLLDWLDFCNTVRLRRSPMDMRERTLRDMALREVTQFLATQPMNEVMSPRGDSLVSSLRQRIQQSFDAARTGVEVVAIQIPVLRPPPGEGQGLFEAISIEVQNARKQRDEAERVANSTMAALMGGREQAAEVVAAIEDLQRLEREKGEASAEASEQRAKVENMLLAARAQAASTIAMARARRWQIVMQAAGNAAQVLGEAPSYRAAPELYKQRRTMEVLARSMSQARVKYILGEGARNAAIDITMQQAEAGLNLGDYLEKKPTESAGGN
jgi:regulator of protease activity HflC (stomatin/prohibitin superfamily)